MSLDIAYLNLRYTDIGCNFISLLRLIIWKHQTVFEEIDYISWEYYINLFNKKRRFYHVQRGMFQDAEFRLFDTYIFFFNRLYLQRIIRYNKAYNKTIFFLHLDIHVGKCIHMNIWNINLYSPFKVLSSAIGNLP